jgi:hypothetical protein
MFGGGHLEVQHARKRITVNVPAGAPPGAKLEVSITQAMLAAAPDIAPSFTVQIPAGMSPGMNFRFRMPNGAITSVVVPPGAAPGSTLKVRV